MVLRLTWTENLTIHLNDVITVMEVGTDNILAQDDHLLISRSLTNGRLVYSRFLQTLHSAY